MLTAKGKFVTTSILKVKGIGPATVPMLTEFGFQTAEDLAAASVEQLGMVPGFGAARAKSIISGAASLLAGEVEAGTGAEKPGKKGKASKNKQKDKKPKKEGKKEKGNKEKPGKKKGKRGDGKKSSNNKKEDGKKRKKGKKKHKK
jgi:hypothetical protein